MEDINFDAPAQTREEEQPISSYSSRSSYSEEGENEMQDPSQQKSQKLVGTKVNEDHFSSLHVFGDNINHEIKLQQQQHFHARLLSHLNPDSVYVPELDQLFQKNEGFNPKSLPTMQGGIDYKEQAQKLVQNTAKIYFEFQYLSELNKSLATQLAQIQASGDACYDRRRLSFRPSNKPRFRGDNKDSEDISRPDDEYPQMDDGYSLSKHSGDGEFSEGGGKRYRRTANEIERRFLCWCGKAYGSEGSLNQHKKIKGHYDKRSSKEKEPKFYPIPQSFF